MKQQKIEFPVGGQPEDLQEAMLREALELIEDRCLTQRSMGLAGVSFNAKTAHLIRAARLLRLSEPEADLSCEELRTRLDSQYRFAAEAAGRFMVMGPGRGIEQAYWAAMIKAELIECALQRRSFKRALFSPLLSRVVRRADGVIAIYHDDKCSKMTLHTASFNPDTPFRERFAAESLGARGVIPEVEEVS